MKTCIKRLPNTGRSQNPVQGDSFPENQEDFDFTFIGLLAFYDPPKHNIENVFNQFYDAGVSVKIITGDNAFNNFYNCQTMWFRDAENTLDGKDLVNISDKDILKAADNCNIFTRMFRKRN